MTTVKEVAFFLTAVGLYVAMFQTTALWNDKLNLDHKYIIAISAVVYILLLLGLFMLLGLKSDLCKNASPILVSEAFISSVPSVSNGSNEPVNGDYLPENSSINMCTTNLPLSEFLMSGNVVSDEAMCKGGNYMWQGDSEKAKRCRELASTTEGKCAIGKYNCGNGYEGKPQKLFEYTPQSNDQWKNTQCQMIGKHSKDGKRNCTVCSQNYA